MDSVTELRAKILPTLETWEQHLSSKHPSVRVKVWDSSTGRLTEWQGHDLGLDCLLENAAHADEPDNVALSVSLCHLDKTPLIHSADVTWGHPSGCIEAEILAAPVVFSAEALEQLLKRLPELFNALQQALERGRPPRT